MVKPPVSHPVAVTAVDPLQFPLTVNVPLKLVHANTVVARATTAPSAAHAATTPLTDLVLNTMFSY
jgi:hypothetical protein